MKPQTLLMIGLIALTTLATAYRQPYGPVTPRFPQPSPYVRTGGFQPSMSFYQVGLRGGINTQPRQDYQMRRRFSDYYYPRQQRYEAQHLRPQFYRPARVGGYFPQIRNYKATRNYRNANVI